MSNQGEEQSTTTIAISASFTAEPLEDSLNFWRLELQSPFRIEFAPYDQVFQQLLYASSLLSKNKHGMNVILVRFEDWIRNSNKVSSKPEPGLKERLLANRPRYTLPNRLEIAHLNQYETEFMYREIFVDRSYMKHGINIKDGDCIIDIGANIGLFTLFVQQECKNTTIYAFEPSPSVFELLKVNTTLYASNAKPFNCGLSSETKEALFTFYEGYSIISGFNANTEEDEKTVRAGILNTLRQNSTYDTGALDEFVDKLMEGKLESESFVCQVKTLSDVIRENKLQHIDLLKIDAEMSELDILKGIEDSDWHKIRQIVMEVHGKERTSIREITALLKKKGFEIAVDDDHLFPDSGIHAVFATQPSNSEESPRQNPLTTEKQEKIKENVNNLLLALKSASERSSTPYLVCVCPASPAAVADAEQIAFFQQMEDLMVSELDVVSSVCLVKTVELTTAYPVSTYYDAYSDELGHVPYTPAFFAALGTTIARKFHAMHSVPYKVIVLDCDQTLWKGVCGEDGPLGIEIDPPRKMLQEFIVGQCSAGMLICLCSKNNEEDVNEVFEYHPEMPLKQEHIVTWRINWRPKSENIKSLASELELGLDSFILIDDNPVECAEVQANCPEVLTLCLPKEPDYIPRFLEHIWVFDHLKITDEDKKRTISYKQNTKREHFRQESLTFKDFLAGLGLEVRILEAMPGYLARVAQLTQRTNQFNCTTVRRSETDVQKLLQSGILECLVTEVSDRFGDYGLVGVILFKAASEAIKVDTFLLSCRAMGRGVEHRMLAKLGELAKERGLGYVEVTYIPTKKNQPASDFLKAIGSKYKEPLDSGFLCRFPIEYVNTLTYTPSTPSVGELAGSVQLDNSSSPGSQISENQVAYTQAKTGLFHHIATNLCSAEQILKIIESQPHKRRPDLSNEYVAPGNGLEHSIASIWQKVLGIEKVGIHDNFFEIGGTSLKGVQLIAQLRREFNVDIPIVSLFEKPTINSMAKMLGNNKDAEAINETTLASRKRGEKRRAKLMSRK